MEAKSYLYSHEISFQLEAGGILPGFQLKYTTLGKLSPEKSNVVWICHALTGSSIFTDWWPGLFKDGSPLDPDDYFFVCANVLGGCYGSTGPLSINPTTGFPYYHTFPTLTNRDIVRAFDLLRQHLGFEKIHTLIGGSLGGQQVLEWAIYRPSVFRYIIPIACNARQSPWGVAVNEAQRMAIEADPSWRSNKPDAGQAGLRAARAMGMISFRSYHAFAAAQQEITSDKFDNYKAATYQRYQGDKLVRRFNAFSFWTLSKAMDSQNTGRGRHSVATSLAKIKARALVIGIDSDGLFPLEEQQLIVQHIPGAQFEVLSSPYGHDAFLIELSALKRIIGRFLKTECQPCRLKAKFLEKE